MTTTTTTKMNKSKDFIFSWHFRALDCNFLRLPSVYTKLLFVVGVVCVGLLKLKIQCVAAAHNDADDILVNTFRMNSDDKLSIRSRQQTTATKQKKNT